MDHFSRGLPPRLLVVAVMLLMLTGCVQDWAKISGSATYHLSTTSVARLAWTVDLGGAHATGGTRYNLELFSAQGDKIAHLLVLSPAGVDQTLSSTATTAEGDISATSTSNYIGVISRIKRGVATIHVQFDVDQVLALRGARPVQVRLSMEPLSTASRSGSTVSLIDLRNTAQITTPRLDVQSGERATVAFNGPRPRDGTLIWRTNGPGGTSIQTTMTCDRLVEGAGCQSVDAASPTYFYRTAVLAPTGQFVVTAEVRSPNGDLASVSTALVNVQQAAEARMVRHDPDQRLTLGVPVQLDATGSVVPAGATVRYLVSGTTVAGAIAGPETLTPTVTFTRNPGAGTTVEMHITFAGRTVSTSVPLGNFVSVTGASS